MSQRDSTLDSSQPYDLTTACWNSQKTLLLSCPCLCRSHTAWQCQRSSQHQGCLYRFHHAAASRTSHFQLLSGPLNLTPIQPIIEFVSLPILCNVSLDRQVLTLESLVSVQQIRILVRGQARRFLPTKDSIQATVCDNKPLDRHANCNGPSESPFPESVCNSAHVQSHLWLIHTPALSPQDHSPAPIPPVRQHPRFHNQLSDVFQG
jgi:hypothetical protein